MNVRVARYELVAERNGLVVERAGFAEWEVGDVGQWRECAMEAHGWLSHVMATTPLPEGCRWRVLDSEREVERDRWLQSRDWFSGGLPAAGGGLDSVVRTEGQ